MDSYGGYLGILKWSLAQSDGTKPSEVKPMSAEDREFFEKAVEEASISDATRMKKTLEAMEKEGISEEECCRLLSILEELLENLDNARDFQNLNGYQKIIDKLNSSESKKVKYACFSLLGTAAQNQPIVQKVLVDAKVIPQLMSYVSSVSDMDLKTKSFSCVCSIVMGYEDAEKVFLFNNGLSIIKEIIENELNSVSLQRRALLLLSDLSMRETMLMVVVTEGDEVQRKFLSKDLINLLAEKYLGSGDIDLKETSIQIVDFVLGLERRSFELSEVRDALMKVLPSLKTYASLSDTPAEVKERIERIEKCIVQ